MTTAAPTDYWITQRLDHFHPLDDRTFQQRFWMNSTFADGNSILFAFAGEAPLQDFYGVSDNFLTQIAQENNMLLIYLEHRFYGHSVPMNDSSEKNLVYLTTDQALEDAVYFLHWATAGNGLPGLAARPKVISFGCSYSGMLSAFFRQKYSWLTVGAIAGSAPVWSVLDFGGYDETMLSVLSNPPNVGCSAIVEKVFDQVVAIYNGPNGTDILRQQFNLCALPRTYSLPELTSALSGYIDVQGNNPDAGFPANAMCQQLLTATQTLTPLQAYTNYVKSQNPGCLEVDALAGIRVPGADRSWTWQTCTEYGFFQTDTQSQLFGGSVPLSFYLDLCQSAFSLDAPDTSQTNYRFGGLWQNQSSWIIFSNGLQDPWGSNLGVNSPLGPNLNVTLSTSAHCAAYHPPNPNDPPNLVQSRQDILAFVKAALKPRFNQG